MESQSWVRFIRLPGLPNREMGKESYHRGHRGKANSLCPLCSLWFLLCPVLFIRPPLLTVEAPVKARLPSVSRFPHERNRSHS